MAEYQALEHNDNDNNITSEKTVSQKDTVINMHYLKFRSNSKRFLLKHITC